MVTGKLDADTLDGTYWPEGSGSFKQVYVDEDATTVAYRPKRGSEDVSTVQLSIRNVNGSCRSMVSMSALRASLVTRMGDCTTG